MFFPSILMLTTLMSIPPSRAANDVPATPAETILHVFSTAPTGGGAFPYAGLIADGTGALFGTISDADCSCGSYGAVFKITLSPSGNTYQTLYEFQGGSDGANPESPLVADRSGALYGTTVKGGSSTCTGGCGAVFKLTPSRSGYLESVLYAFQGGADGAFPTAPLVIGKHGVLYGTAPYGGDMRCDPYGCGTAFRLEPHGSGYLFSVVHTFLGPVDAANPVGGLTLGAGGILYGTTSGGPGGGTAYVLTPNGSTYTEAIVHHFLGGSDGLDPEAGLTIDAQGALYGTTAHGGNGHCDGFGCGIVFKITPQGSTYDETVVHAFRGGPNDGARPIAAVAIARNGDILGTTQAGGSANYGTVFRLRRHGSKAGLRLLHRFGGFRAGDGDDPVANVLLSRSEIFGTTLRGGSPPRVCNCGTVFELSDGSS